MQNSLPAAISSVLQAWVSQFTFYAKNRWARAPRRQNVVLCLEVAAALLPRLGVMVAGYWVEGLALFVVGWLIGAIVLLYLFAYIVHRPHERVGRYVDTSTILLPRVLHTPLTWLWMFQNYHSIHHLFPRVPFYKYAELFEEIEDVMDAKGATVYRTTLRGLEPASTRVAT
jgi:beta-carotene hydroxylase